jgi:glucose-6-phosphate isomerase
MTISVSHISEACLSELISVKAASRLAAKDASLFSFSNSAEKLAMARMGWTDLCSNPPLDPDALVAFASQARCEGLEAVVLIGQGGSTQAAMTITKLNALKGGGVSFKTMDSLSPVYVSHILGSSDPAKTLYIVSSKSGSTIEPMMLLKVVWQYVSAYLGPSRTPNRFIAITDEGSELEAFSRENNFRATFTGSDDIGGRYSALSIFGLLPMSLVGIDLGEVFEQGSQTQRFCSKDSSENPAIRLAAFLYENYLAGRDKFSLVMPSSGQVFGLWIEQLVAESLGKDSKGILPNVEVDAGVLSVYHRDRCAISYAVGNTEGFQESLDCIHPDIPMVNAEVTSPIDIVNHFIIWEYAIALCAYLMKVNPFDQPDVEITKKLVKSILYEGTSEFKALSEAQTHANLSPSYRRDFEESEISRFMEISTNLIGGIESENQLTLDCAIKRLLASIEEGDYFVLAAYLPFFGIGRREALERMRHRVVDRIGAVSCLEIGPRYLHSTGQLHKGGSNTGIFLILSADELNDMPIPSERFSLSDLVLAQARADFEALASLGRRVLHIHLIDNDSRTLSKLADRICTAVSASQASKSNAK